MIGGERWRGSIEEGEGSEETNSHLPLPTTNTTKVELSLRAECLLLAIVDTTKSRATSSVRAFAGEFDQSTSQNREDLTEEATMLSPLEEIPHPCKELLRARIKTVLERLSNDDKSVVSTLQTAKNDNSCLRARQATLSHVRRTLLLDRPNSLPVDRLVLASGPDAAYDMLGFALLEPGDTVLTPAPFNNRICDALEERSQAEIWPVPFNDLTKPVLDVSCFETVFEHAVSQGRSVRAVALSNPYSPTGVIFPAGDIVALINWAVQKDLWVIMDESLASFSTPSSYTYSSYTAFHSILPLLDDPNFASTLSNHRLIWVYDLGEELTLRGLNFTALYTTNNKLHKVLCCLESMQPCAPLVQAFVTGLLEERIDEKEEEEATHHDGGYAVKPMGWLHNFAATKTRLLEDNRRLVVEWLDEMHLPFCPAESGTSLLINLKEFLLSTFIDEESLACQFGVETGVKLHPGLSMGTAEEGWFRLSIGKERAKLLEELHRMQQFLTDLRTRQQSINSLAMMRPPTVIVQQATTISMDDGDDLSENEPVEAMPVAVLASDVVVEELNLDPLRTPPISSPLFAALLDAEAAKRNEILLEEPHRRASFIAFVDDEYRANAPQLPTLVEASEGSAKEDSWEDIAEKEEPDTGSNGVGQEEETPAHQSTPFSEIDWSVYGRLPGKEAKERAAVKEQPLMGKPPECNLLYHSDLESQRVEANGVYNSDALLREVFSVFPIERLQWVEWDVDGNEVGEELEVERGNDNDAVHKKKLNSGVLKRRIELAKRIHWANERAAAGQERPKTLPLAPMSKLIREQQCTVQYPYSIKKLSAISEASTEASSSAGVMDEVESAVGESGRRATRDKFSLDLSQCDSVSWEEGLTPRLSTNTDKESAPTTPPLMNFDFISQLVYGGNGLMDYKATLLHAEVEAAGELEEEGVKGGDSQIPAASSEIPLPISEVVGATNVADDLLAQVFAQLPPSSLQVGAGQTFQGNEIETTAELTDREFSTTPSGLHICYSPPGVTAAPLTIEIPLISAGLNMSGEEMSGGEEPQHNGATQRITLEITHQGLDEEELSVRTDSGLAVSPLSTYAAESLPQRYYSLEPLHYPTHTDVNSPSRCSEVDPMEAGKRRHSLVDALQSTTTTVQLSSSLSSEELFPSQAVPTHAKTIPPLLNECGTKVGNGIWEEPYATQTQLSTTSAVEDGSSGKIGGAKQPTCDSDENGVELEAIENEVGVMNKAEAVGGDLRHPSPQAVFHFDNYIDEDGSMAAIKWQPLENLFDVIVATTTATASEEPAWLEDRGGMAKSIETSGTGLNAEPTVSESVVKWEPLETLNEHMKEPEVWLAANTTGSAMPRAVISSLTNPPPSQLPPPNSALAQKKFSEELARFEAEVIQFQQQQLVRQPTQQAGENSFAMKEPPSSAKIIADYNAIAEHGASRKLATEGVEAGVELCFAITSACISTAAPAIVDKPRNGNEIYGVLSAKFRSCSMREKSASPEAGTAMSTTWLHREEVPPEAAPSIREEGRASNSPKSPRRYKVFATPSSTEDSGKTPHSIDAKVYRRHPPLSADHRQAASIGGGMGHADHHSYAQCHSEWDYTRPVEELFPAIRVTTTHPSYVVSVEKGGGKAEGSWDKPCQVGVAPQPPQVTHKICMSREGPSRPNLASGGPSRTIVVEHTNITEINYCHVDRVLEDKRVLKTVEESSENITTTYMACRNPRHLSTHDHCDL